MINNHKFFFRKMNINVLLLKNKILYYNNKKIYVDSIKNSKIYLKVTMT